MSKRNPKSETPEMEDDDEDAGLDSDRKDAVTFIINSISINF